MDALLDQQSAARETIRAYLRSERDRIFEEIRAYPTPIPRCDAQFNHLIEKRERLVRELARLETVATSSTVAGDGTARIEAFIASSESSAPAGFIPTTAAQRSGRSCAA